MAAPSEKTPFRQWKARCGLTYQEIADRANAAGADAISHHHIRNIAAGYRRPIYDLAVILSRLTNGEISVDALMRPRANDPPTPEPVAQMERDTIEEQARTARIFAHWRRNGEYMARLVSPDWPDDEDRERIDSETLGGEQVRALRYHLRVAAVGWEHLSAGERVVFAVASLALSLAAGALVLLVGSTQMPRRAPIAPPSLPEVVGLVVVLLELAALAVRRGWVQMGRQFGMDVHGEVAPPCDGPIAVSYGGGVNSVASLIWLAQHGYTPTAIVMADPGSEWQATIRYRDEILPSWLDSVGFPRATVINRIDEGQYNPRAWRLETLREECLRLHAIPSIAYGWKKCSAKYKGDTQRWWIARQPWAQEEWAAGRRVVKVIGYDAGESERVRVAFPNKWEAARLAPWYPLHATGLDRDGCADLILSVGLPLPPKSACTYCPNNTLEEWVRLREQEPDAFAQAVEMSRNAADSVEQPDVVGLMRCNPRGRRQLHVWADGGYGSCGPGEEGDNPMPCECSL